MKKILMTIAAAFVATTMSAQVYVGGNIGFNTSSDKTNKAAETTVTGFNINPEIGMALDDKMGVGIVLGFGTNTTKTENNAVSPSTSVKKTTTDFNIKPYLRYQCFSAGKFNVFVDGGVDFGISKTKDMKPAMDLGLFLTPGLAYSINEKWSMVAKLNDMFAFGYHKDAVADVDNAPSAPTNINAGLSTSGFNLGGLTFGVFYNF